MGNKGSNRAEKERKRLEKSLKRNPSAALHCQMAELLKRKYHDFHRARIHFEQALRLHPQNTFARNNLAMILKNNFNDLEGARAHLLRVIALDPNHAVAHNNLGVLLCTLNHPHQAKKHFEAALRIRPNYPNARTNLQYITALIQRTSEQELGAHTPEIMKLQEEVLELKQKVFLLEQESTSNWGSDRENDEIVRKLTMENGHLRDQIGKMNKKLQVQNHVDETKMNLKRHSQMNTLIAEERSVSDLHLAVTPPCMKDSQSDKSAGGIDLTFAVTPLSLRDPGSDQAEVGLKRHSQMKTIIDERSESTENNSMPLPRHQDMYTLIAATTPSM